MSMPLPGTGSVVSGAFEHLLDMGGGRNSISRVTRPSAEGHPFRVELDAGVAVDRGKRVEISRVDGTNSGIDTFPVITIGGLSCLRLRAKYSLYPWR